MSGAGGAPSAEAGTTGGAGTTTTGGSSGAAGTTGSAGTSAAAGTTGTAGTSGGAGTTGAAGTTGSAGTSGGAGTTGGAGTGGGAANACATALYCDDFESYAAGAAPGGSWTRQTSTGAAIAIDTTQFRSGTKSVKFTTPAGSGSKTAYIRLAAPSVFPAAAGGFFGRMMFRLESAPTTSMHWTILQGSGLVPGQSYHALYRYGGQQPVMQGSTFVGSQMMANYETPDSYSGSGPGSDCWFHANRVVVPVGAWTCLEWQFEGATNTMRLWMNGAAVPSLTVTGVGQGCVNQPNSYPWTAPRFDRLDLGWEGYQQDSARTLWIDDVAVSATKIGCP
jgi:hypothetical protein